MRVKVEGYACDQCNQFSRDQAGWLRVAPITHDADAEVEVCSPACLLKMARELVRAEADVPEQELEHQAKQATLNKRQRDNQKYQQKNGGGPVKCEVEGCGRTFKNIQGLSMHRVRIHEGNYWSTTDKLNGESSASRTEAST